MKMSLTVTSIRKQTSGYGHFKISIYVSGELIQDGIQRDVYNELFIATTTNTLAIDAYFDTYYDDIDRSEYFYNNRSDAAKSLINEVLRKNDIESEYQLDLDF